MNNSIKSLLKTKQDTEQQLHREYALKILSVLKDELKGFDLRNQHIVIEYAMGGVYVLVNGKDFTESKYRGGYRKGTWHKLPVFNCWKKLMEILLFLNEKENDAWTWALDNETLVSPVSPRAKAR